MKVIWVMILLVIAYLHMEFTKPVAQSVSPMKVYLEGEYNTCVEQNQYNCEAIKRVMNRYE